MYPVGPNGPGDDTLFRGCEYEGRQYSWRCALQIGANPATPAIALDYDPYAVARIQAFDEELYKWFDLFESDPGILYVSDGNPNTVTIPNESASLAGRHARRIKSRRPHVGEVLSGCRLSAFGYRQFFEDYMMHTCPHVAEITGKDSQQPKANGQQPQIILAEEMGYCWGVRRAVDIITEAASAADPVATIGDVIHNPQVVERLRARG